MIELPFKTNRLTLRLIRETDGPFLVSLVQSEGWLRFIGERQIAGPGKAEAYIRDILNHPGKTILVIALQQTGKAIGILTFLKRDHLPFPDLGFALLPAYEKMGYALEASRAFLERRSLTEKQHPLLAITLPENERSISLLRKLGFHYSGDVKQESKTLSLFRLNP